MEVAEAFSLISRAIDEGRAAHGYLIVGDVRGNCEELTWLIVKKLLLMRDDRLVGSGVGERPPSENIHVEDIKHPDVMVLSPEGALRIITVKSMRERLIDPMLQTSFSGGWKIGVIVSADRLGAPGKSESANAFLKLLEEPPPHTIFLLLTDRPDLVVPTIVSRSQRIDLELPIGIFEGEQCEAIASAYAAKDATALAEILASVLDDADEEDYALVRRKFYRTLEHFAREMMVTQKLPLYQTFRNIEAVEEAFRRSDRLMNNESVLSYMLDRTVFQ